MSTCESSACFVQVSEALRGILQQGAQAAQGRALPPAEDNFSTNSTAIDSPWEASQLAKLHMLIVLGGLGK